MSESEFRRKLTNLLNAESMENGSNTPDFILAQFLADSLRAFDEAVSHRTLWYAPPKDTAASDPVGPDPLSG